MNFKKTILYLLSGILILVLIYNYVLPYIVAQNVTGMGMHMEYINYGNSLYYYGGIISFFIFLLIIITIVLVLVKILASPSRKKCRKCGYDIDSDEWQICPRCGNPLYNGSVK